MKSKVKPLNVFYFDGKTMQVANIRELSPDRSYAVAFIENQAIVGQEGAVSYIEEHVSRSDLFETLRIKSAGHNYVNAVILPQFVHREMFRMMACINRSGVTQ